MDNWFNPLLGGILIGLASSVLLFFSGKIAGISGILGSCLNKASRENYWRYFFVLGLAAGSFILSYFSPGFFAYEIPMGWTAAVVGGLFVGYGTRVGSGCTSGHGVCGLSRFSKRSFVATLTFMFTAIVTVMVVKLF